jgi:hypothetical protein
LVLQQQLFLDRQHDVRPGAAAADTTLAANGSSQRQIIASAAPRPRRLRIVDEGVTGLLRAVGDA